MRRATFALLLWALFGVTLTTIAFVVMVRLHVGQRIDFSAYEGRKWMSHGFRRVLTFVVRFVTPLIVLSTAVASVVVAYRRRSARAAVAAAVAAPAVLLTTTMLKVVLPRPDLLEGSWISTRNTYPSGHLATVTVVMLVAISVSPPSWRPSVTAIAGVTVALHTLAIAASGWHRPSDLVGGLGVAVAVGAVTATVAGQWRDGPVQRSEPWWSRPSACLVGSLAVMTIVSAWFLVGRMFGHRSYGSFFAHVTVVSCVVLSGYLVVAVHASLVDARDNAIRPCGIVDQR